MIIGDAFDNQTALVQWYIEWGSAHGTRGIARAREFPPIKATCVKLVVAIEFPDCALTVHGAKADGALRASVLPAPFFEAFNFLLACATFKSAGPTLSHYLYDVLLLYLGGAPACPSHLELE